MLILDKIIKESEGYYRITGNPAKKLYLDMETYNTFMAEVHKKYDYFFAMNGNKDPLQFNGMEIIKINNWRIE